MPMLPVPSAIRFQPVAADEVAARLVALALGQPQISIIATHAQSDTPRTLSPPQQAIGGACSGPPMPAGTGPAKHLG